MLKEALADETTSEFRERLKQAGDCHPAHAWLFDTNGTQQSSVRSLIGLTSGHRHQACRVGR